MWAAAATPAAAATGHPGAKLLAALLLQLTSNRPCPALRCTSAATPAGIKQAAEWFDIAQLPGLAFDHKLIVRTAFRHLARQDAVQQQQPGLPGALQSAADALEGPWQQH